MVKNILKTTMYLLFLFFPQGPLNFASEPISFLPFLMYISQPGKIYFGISLSLAKHIKIIVNDR